MTTFSTRYRRIENGVTVVDVTVPAGTSHADAWKAVTQQ